MALLDAKKTYQNLLKKGFKAAKGDHKFLEFHYNGKIILHTKISHGESDLQNFHIGMMTRQCKLEKKDFLDLALCPLSEKGYVEILKGAGIILEDEAKRQSENPNIKNKKRK